MCTVTLFPQNDNEFILTSNRDEAPLRKALIPDVYEKSGISLWYPKDPDGKGSWIGVSSQNRAVCLLNGAFEKHKRELPYRQSRGLVVIDFLISDSIEEAMESYNLQSVEPFTLIMVDWNTDMKWFELVWDGTHRHVKQLPIEPNIWSSTTLYDKTMRKERQQWFKEFLNKKKFSPEEVLKFHRETENSNSHYGVIMDRGFVKTTSITQIVKDNGLINLSFGDLQENKHYEHTIDFPLILNE